MTGQLDAPWFLWAVGIALGFPLALVVLTELHNALLRRHSALARPVHLLRNYILPLGILLLLLVKATQVSAEATPVRIVSTVFGFVVLVLLLSGLNATLFQSAPEGSWRKRIPSIFLDVARFAIIAIGVGLMFSFIWGADVGRLFTALGVTSIVLGLALQNSVGQIISGLLLLFEQPFQLGDWIEAPTARGRVIEVNWRATHIDTGSGMLIMPNSVLALASFTNFSRPPGTHSLSVSTAFSVDDPPDDVIAMLNRVAATLPQLRPDAAPSSNRTGALQYSTGIPVRTPADDFAAKSLFLRWVWYASRRAGLHLDEAEDEFATPERLEASLRIIAPTLRLTAADQQALLPRATLTRYGTEEYLQFAGQVPKRMTFLVNGRVRLVASGDDGAIIPVRILEEGDFLGQTALTREAVTASAYALEEVTVLQIEREYIEELVERKPLLLQDIGRAIEERRKSLRRALAAAGD
ncbi:mechanosensitive ion channel domain-containing protein [Mycobacterium sp. AZCC_0083]|uniref:mechanosensitive ion channel domain-containing protein n=1 Tax=Mycobacterium sp. AZCC_0083 TaxID=2735882 RepID=UPI00161F6E8F|nr:mechanosensitive ion channel family protein [Mycobacterium sp. AZCC_0083]MBB5160949.1 small-conductance mechanosensitive channel [Mycobacterium sp. AZCC_0083]